jgi:hypothetical protein
MIAIPAVLKAVPWKLVGYATVAICISIIGWRISVWHEAYKALPEAKAALEAEVACKVPSKCADRVAALQARQAEVQRVSKETYDQEIADLKNRPVPIPRIIRVCKSAAAGSVPVAGAAEGSSGPETGGVLLGPSELDTGPLRRAAAEADEINAAYRFLTNRDNALASPVK